jgi:alpha/beta superfamily hydrolase
MTAMPLPSGHLHATARLRTVDLHGPAGRLEAVLNEGSQNAPAAALVCHPHPLGGGTLHNKVVYHAMKALNAPDFGLHLPVLRFNFRGTGRSEGEHHGKAEAGDVTAAVNWLAREFDRPLLVLGFSFGAAMSLLACCGDPRVKALCALGLPTHADGRDYHYHFLEGCTTPKLFLSGNLDQYAPIEDLGQVVAQAADPKRLLFISGADHFFTNHLSAMQAVVADWAKEHTA